MSKLEKSIANMEQELAKMKKELEIAKKWEPKGEGFIIGGCGSTYAGTHPGPDYKGHGTAFETRFHAEKAAKYYRFIHRLYKLAEEMNAKHCAEDMHPYGVSRYTGDKFLYERKHGGDSLLPLFTSLASMKEGIKILNKEGHWDEPSY